ncbi:hypothetical protein ACIHCQ_42270 [Streptomyces sp. NPDC052236]|uniref:hypothetical protein n=1 Tax=Streptomyces sp. NPDC052236 TaxID=3365686 RepID=UPI0037CCC808
MTRRATNFTVAYALLRAAADVADHWVQSDYCAQAKGATDKAPVTTTDEKTEAETVNGTKEGRRACAWHCATYTATQGLVLVAGSRAVGIRLHPGAVAGALAVSGITHYIADRRVPDGVLHRLAKATGKERFFKLADHGMNGAYALDQAWHHGAETVAALIAAAK